MSTKCESRGGREYAHVCLVGAISVLMASMVGCGGAVSPGGVSWDKFIVAQPVNNTLQTECEHVVRIDHQGDWEDKEKAKAKQAARMFCMAVVSMATFNAGAGVYNLNQDVEDKFLSGLVRTRGYDAKDIYKQLRGQLKGSCSENASGIPRATPGNECLAIRIELYSGGSGRVLGYTSDDDIIHTNRSWFSANDASQIAGHWLHENMHVLGYSHTFRRSSEWPRTVPYAFGYAAVSVLSSLAQPPPPAAPPAGLVTLTGSHVPILDEVTSQGYPGSRTLLVTDASLLETVGGEPAIEVSVRPTLASNGASKAEKELGADVSRDDEDEDEKARDRIIKPSLTEDAPIPQLARAYSPLSGLGPITPPGSKEELLARMLAKRVQAVGAELLHTLLANALPNTSKPMRDLLERGLMSALDRANSKALSETVFKSLVRASLSLWIAEGIESGWLRSAVSPHAGPLRPGVCPRNNLVNVVYETLAASELFQKEPFPASTGQLSEACLVVQKNLSEFILHSTVLPADIDALQAFLTDAPDLFQPGHDCAGETLALSSKRLVDAKTQLNIPGLSIVSRLALLHSAWRDEPAAGRTGVSPKCSAALSVFEQQFDTLLSRIDVHSPLGQLNVAGLKAEINRIGSRLQAIPCTPDPNKPYKCLSVELSHQLQQEAAAVLRSLFVERKLNRRTTLRLIEEIRRSLDRQLGSRKLQTIVDGMLEDAGLAIEEDAQSPLGIRVDTRVLAASTLARVTDMNRPGAYLRATVGAGGFTRTGEPTDRGRSGLSFYEEIGVGYRWGLWNGRLLLGPHAMVSGLGFLVSPANPLDRHLIVAGGASLNVLKLLDVSASAGWAADLQARGQSGAVFLLGLQLPIVDYVGALSSDNKP